MRSLSLCAGGAECTAAVIYLARTGYSKEAIREYVDDEFGYDMSESLDRLRKRHRHVETCQDSLPKALVSFFEGDSYEEVVRNAVSLGGDTDTLGAIAGAMAEAFYGIPEELIAVGKKFLPEEMVKVVETFRKNQRCYCREDKMATHEQNIEILWDTKAMIKESATLSSAVKHSIARSEVYYEDNYPLLPSMSRGSLEISVTSERTFEAAMRLRGENADDRIAVLNFANAFISGGGVEGGANAQEECLCRTSTLFPCIGNRKMWDSFYKHHQDIQRPLSYKATDSLIYTPDVVIIKTDENLPKRLPEDKWVTVDVITAAAPHIGPIEMSDQELFGLHVKRAVHILSVAASKNVDVLVLGAFGCGAFRNNPEVVARAYKVALQEFAGAFQKIVFAVYCPPQNTTNYEVFSRVLSGESIS